MSGEPNTPNRRPMSSEARPSRLLVLLGLLLIAMCTGAAAEQHDALAGTLVVLGVGVIMVAVFAQRLRGPVELGPAGMKFELGEVASEVVGISAEIGQRLDRDGVGLTDLATGQSDTAVSAETHADVKRLLETLEVLTRRLESADNASPSTWLTPAARLEIARGLLAERRWIDAAAMLDRYAEAEPGDWEAQFVRGVAHANTRSGRDGNLAALRAYNEALAFAPQDSARAWFPRAFGYRGAMLKRLNRLQEAESDLLIARTLATSQLDANDIDYNLAAIYAMSGRRDDAMRLVRKTRENAFSLRYQGPCRGLFPQPSR